MVHFPKFSKDFLLKFRMFIHIIPDLQHLTIWLKQFAQKQSMEANCSKLSVLILLTKLTSFHFTDLPAHANVLLIATRNTWSKSIRFFLSFCFCFTLNLCIYNLFADLLLLHNHRHYHSIIIFSIITITSIISTIIVIISYITVITLLTATQSELRCTSHNLPFV